MSAPLVVIGGGEHARVVIDAARTRPDCWQVVGFADDRPCEDTVRLLGVARLGDDAAVLTLLADHHVIIGVGAVGAAAVRLAIADRYRDAGARFATVVHARAWVSPHARLGAGVAVFAGAVVNAGAVVEDHCVISTGAIVEHDCTVGALTQVGPGSVIGGGASIGRECQVGLGSRIRDHVRIHDRVIVGMGAVVVNDVGADLTVIGHPARDRGPRA